MNYKIRPIRATDNARVEAIIRSCLIEFGGNHEGTAWMDPDLGRFSEIYKGPRNAYWVAEDEAGKVVGGAGIGELPGMPDTCELQKMYCIPEARGTGIAHLLIQTALSFAENFYENCYLETLGSMKRAQRFYEQYGFSKVSEVLGETGHTACDLRYLKSLKKEKD